MDKLTQLKVRLKNLPESRESMLVEFNNILGELEGVLIEEKLRRSELLNKWRAENPTKQLSNEFEKLQDNSKSG